jgi:sterol desaturase/sphingolipid hydroxylase (fatty acid hydroxylase superfamily)
MNFVAAPPIIFGLLYGIGSVILGQFALLSYIWWYTEFLVVTRKYVFAHAVMSHLSQFEGIFLLGIYLSVSWYGGWLPSSYYVHDGSIHWALVGTQLIVQDAGQYVMHRIEHYWKPLYRIGHQYHHKHIHPQWFHAFDGSIVDTCFMILVPLVITSQVVREINTPTYIAFGTVYSVSLVLIHSDFPHPWEPVFQSLLLGTSKDHQLHHQYRHCNYGHIFMWWDVLCGTYKK